MKNIHLIPTDKGQRITKTNKGTFLFCSVVAKDFIEIRKDYSGFHLYITSDEEIKEGDWVIYNNELQKSDGISFKSVDKKIILTTDQDLITDGVQAIDEEFLQWFVKNPSCESVEVETDRVFRFDEFHQREFFNRHKIIIPKEEPKQETHICKYCGVETTQSDNEYYAKQETIEEIAQWVIDNRYAKSELVKISDFEMYHTIIDKCSKWQEERMYSEEEVQLILSKLLFDIKHKKAENSVKWFEQFKKK